MRKTLMILAGMFMVTAANAAAPGMLTGTANVSITSDTAASAKTIAFNEARRQIINDVLRQYVQGDQFAVAMSNASNSDLANLVASSSIDGEQLSSDAYSANITMTLDSVAVEKWLTSAGVQNWIPTGDTGNRTTVVITMSDPLVDWIELNRIARVANIEISAKYIMGNQIRAELSSARRTDFTIAVRDAGWRYAGADGVLKIWK